MNHVMMQLIRAAIGFAQTDLELSAKFMRQGDRDLIEGTDHALKLRVRYTERRLKLAKNQIDAALALLRSDHE